MVHVVVDVTCCEQEVPFQVCREIRVLIDIELEGHLSVVVDDFLHTVVRLGPIPVVDVVVVIPRRRDRDLEEVWIDEHGRCGHESTARVAVDADAVQIDEVVAISQLL